MVDDEAVFDYCRKRVLVMGCGNILYGDDGFGPEVIKYMEKNCEIPEDATLLDAGSGARDITFNIVVSEKKPEVIIIVDAVSFTGKEPGDMFEITLEELGAEKSDDFFMHMVPTSNMLVDLRNECGVDVVILACQAGYIPEQDMEQGLSEPVAKSVPRMAEMVLDKVRSILEK